MAGIGPGDLYELAEELLEVCVEALDSIPDDFPAPPSPNYLPDLDGAPERRYVSPGPPVADCCEFLAVHVNNVTDRFARNADAGAAKANVPSLIVTLLRCVPVGSGDGNQYTPPSTDDLQATSRQLYADGWALWNHIYNLIEAKQFLSRCAQVAFTSMQSIAPEGGCGGWQLAITTELDGYREELGT